MHKLLSEMPNISDHFITLWSMLGTVVAAVVAAVSLIIYAVIYKAQLRHLKWSANQELMRTLMDLDKLIIQYPAYQWMVWPTEHSRPPSSDALQDDACARGLLYFHLNMFDMAHGYYTRILGYGARRAIMARDRQERDDWEGWKEYMRNFMAQEYAATIFRSEGERWFSPEFVKFLGQMITEGQSSAKAAKVHILAPSASYSGSTGVQY